MPDVVVGGEPGSPTALSRLSSVMANASGTEIVVRHGGRVTVWDVAMPGEPVLEFARRTDVPPVGDLRAVDPDSAGLWIRYDGGWGRFGRDGSLQRSIPTLPEGWSGSVALPDGTFLVRGREPLPHLEFTWEPGHPAWQIAVAHLRFADGGWTADTLAMHDRSGTTFAVQVGRTQTFTGQPFGDYDLRYLDQRHAVAGFVERRGGAGGVRVVEIGLSGDTVLDARIPVPEVPLARGRAEEEILSRVESVEEDLQRFRIDTVSTSEVRAIVEAALYVPDALPLVTAVVPTISNEVWLRSSERSDSAAVWYVLARSNPEATPRRVLLPDWFRVRDATRSHVWGLRRDASFSGQVQGRRLAPP